MPGTAPAPATSLEDDTNSNDSDPTTPDPDAPTSDDSVIFPDQSLPDMDSAMQVPPEPSAPIAALSLKATEDPVLKVYYQFYGKSINQDAPITVPVTMGEEINLGALLDELSSNEILPENGTYQISSVWAPNKPLYAVDYAYQGYSLDTIVFTVGPNIPSITASCNKFTPDTSVTVVYIDSLGNPLENTETRTISQVIAGEPYSHIIALDDSYFMPLNGLVFGGFDCKVPILQNI